MSEETATIESAVAVEAPARKRKRDTKRKKQPRYHVVLWDDNDHSYGYVIMMLRSLFGHDRSIGMKMAQAVDSYGRVICMTTTKELAEFLAARLPCQPRSSLKLETINSITHNESSMTLLTRMRKRGFTRSR